MPTTEIPPRKPTPVPPSAALGQGSDLYDADGWESAFRESYDAPALLVQLQDDLSRSRQREAFWISVVVHLGLIVLIVNSQKLEAYLHQQPVIAVSPRDVFLQKELTYLQLPPDEQKLTKRPNADRISDKDRIATSRAPQLDREELKKILDASRPGRPGPNGQSAPSAPTPATAQGTMEPQPPSAPRPAANQIAQMQAPPMGAAKPSFTTSMSPGSAIEQAARAAAASRGGYGGDSGDYGLNQGRQPAKSLGQLEILSDTMGVDFGPYLSRILHDIRESWIRAIPESVEFKKGKLSIQFVILKDGRVTGMQLFTSSGDVPLDRAAWAGITASNPLPPLPSQFPGQYLELRILFCYNLDHCDPN